MREINIDFTIVSDSDISAILIELCDLHRGGYSKDVSY